MIPKTFDYKKNVFEFVPKMDNDCTSKSYISALKSLTSNYNLLYHETGKNPRALCTMHNPEKMEIKLEDIRLESIKRKNTGENHMGRLSHISFNHPRSFELFMEYHFIIKE